MHYFIKIEKMLYKDLIIKNLSSQLNIIKTNQKPKINNKKMQYIF